jgi:hypothetical protein
VGTDLIAYETSLLVCMTGVLVWATLLAGRRR